MRINSFIDARELEKDTAVLSPDESHHLVRVLRVQPGQEITLFDGQGGGADASVETISKTALQVRISQRWQVPPPVIQIDLIQAVPKPDRWELVLQKAVELGASNIHPVLTQHTESRPNAKKMERWQKIVLNAAQQCEVRWMPKLHALEQMEAILPRLKNHDLVLVGSLYKDAMPLRDVLKVSTLQQDGQALRSDSGQAKPAKVALLVGPEGDFSPEEVDAAVAAGAVPVSFGNRILRTETAAIFGLSVLAYELL